jgi:hypothetical protein
MLDALQHPPFIVGEDESLEVESADLVTLKIYRRDPEFSDIIFKPQTFLFDLSRFVTLSGQVTNERLFAKVVDQNFLLTDITGEAGIGVSDSLGDFKAHSEYNLLTDEQKLEVFENHIIDRLLRLYIKLLTGMNLSEFTFIANEDLLITREVDPEVKEILERIAQVIDEPTTSAITGAVARGGSLSNVLITNFANNLSPPASIRTTLGLKGFRDRDRTTNSDANDSSVSTEEESEEEIEQVADPVLEAQFKRLLNSLFFRASEQKIRVEQPKLFERIFSIPVDPDDFEIDIELTESTPNGEAALNSLSFKSCIIDQTDEAGNRTVKLKPRPSDEGSYEFSEIFAVVSLGVDET